MKMLIVSDVDELVTIALLIEAALNTQEKNPEFLAARQKRACVELRRRLSKLPDVPKEIKMQPGRKGKNVGSVHS